MSEFLVTTAVAIVILGSLAMLYNKTRVAMPHVTIPNIGTRSWKTWVSVVILASLAIAIWLIKPSSEQLIWWGLVFLFFGWLIVKIIPTNQIWKAGAYWTIFLALIAIVIGLSTSGLRQWAERVWESEIEECLGKQECISSGLSTSGSSIETAIILTADTHEIRAPKDSWIWYELPKYLCVRFEGRDPNGNNFVSQSEDRRGARAGSNIDGQNTQYRAFMSISGYEEPIFPKIRKRDSYGKCPEYIWH